MNRIFLIITASLFLISFGNQAFAQYDEQLAILETNLGTIVIEFFPEDAPNHVNNFIKLAESGFYDGTLFHRIIPGFMIQGGDPNTIDGDPSTWGTGGPSEQVDAEFNNIKHKQGIVSMARASSFNSAGSQFFIVHENSDGYEYSLDGQYTVFGRIVTQESLDTLDKIATVETKNGNMPTNPEQVRITNIEIVNRSEISNLLELSEPERTQSTITPSTGNQKFESAEHEIEFSVPEGWLLQEPDKSQPNAPDVVAVGPKIGKINPVISLTVQQTDGKTLDEIISENSERLKEFIESGNWEIISEEKTTVNDYSVYVTNAKGIFSSNGEEFNVKFKEIMVYDTEKIYRFAYSNDIDDFDSQLSRFEETIDSFKILSKDTSSTNELVNDEEEKEEGGCLIATATYGSEMAPQVQQLRELRDNSLLSTQSGTAFMTGFNQFYYSFSPIVADLEREHPIFKEAVKIVITPMISSLLILNYVDMDSEIKVLGYGLSLIILNLGMYIAIPAIVINKLRK